MIGAESCVFLHTLMGILETGMPHWWRSCSSWVLRLEVGILAMGQIVITGVVMGIFLLVFGLRWMIKAIPIGGRSDRRDPGKLGRDKARQGVGSSSWPSLLSTYLPTRHGWGVNVYWFLGDKRNPLDVSVTWVVAGLAHRVRINRHICLTTKRAARVMNGSEGPQERMSVIMARTMTRAEMPMLPE